MNAVVIKTSGLTKTFRDGVVAVNELDLEIERGAVYGLMGRNGSGKTTTLRLLLGLLQPDHGSARVLGWDFWRAPRSVRTRAAYVSQTQQLPAGRTLEELSRCLKRLNEQWDPGFARSLADAWGLPWKRPLGCLSSGEQRKAAILIAFACRPEVLVLDEPAAGFDLVARRELVAQIVEAITRGDCTVLVSTHLIGDLERVADHIGVIDSGRMAMSERLEDLLSRTKRVQVIFEGEQPPPHFVVPGAVRTRWAGPVANAIVQWTDRGEMNALRDSTNARIQVFPMGLEEIFIELFGHDARNGVDLVKSSEGKEQ